MTSKLAIASLSEAKPATNSKSGSGGGFLCAASLAKLACVGVGRQ